MGMPANDRETIPRLKDRYGVAEDLLHVTLFSFGGGTEELPALWGELEKAAPGGAELLDAFGSNAAVAIVRSRDGRAAWPLLEMASPIRLQQITAFQPEPLHEWLGSRQKMTASAARERYPLVAIVLLKLRDDALIEDSHLLPAAIAEQGCAAIAAPGRRIWVEPWLPIGPEDLLFVLRSSSVKAIGEALSALRGSRLGDVFDLDRPIVGPFSEAARLARVPVLNPALVEQLREEDAGRWTDGGFASELRLVTATHTVLAIDHRTTSKVKEAIEAAAPANHACPGPVERARELGARVLGGSGCLPGLLSTEGLDGTEEVHARLVLRVRPGRDAAVREILGALLDGALADPHPDLPRGLFGLHDLVLLGGEAKVRLPGAIGLLCLVEFLRYHDPILKWRMQHLVQGTSTSFDEMGLGAGEQDGPAELDPFSAGEMKAPEGSLRARMHRCRPLVLDRFQLRLRTWDQWSQENDPPWLPRHVHRAASRLIQLYNSGLREHSTAVYLLDLLPAIRALVEIIETGRMSSQEDELGDWLSWAPVPWLHGGRGMRSELLTRRAVQHIVETIRLLDDGLKQRLRARLADPAGDLSISMIGRRQKWLSGIAVLIPAIQEQILPFPDLFLRSGLVLLDTIERPLEVTIPDFAFVHIGADVLDRPEMLVSLFQELGHLALRDPVHQRAVAEVREAVDKLLQGSPPGGRKDARRINQTLEELFSDLTLALLCFQGQIDEYGDFVLRRLPNLAPRAHPRHRRQVWERLFVVSVLLDAEGRRQQEAESGQPEVDAGPDDRRWRRIANAARRFCKMVLDLLPEEAPPQRSRDRWGARAELLGRAANVNDVDFERPIWIRLQQTARDVLELMTPARLDLFQIGGRSILDWLKNLGRRHREMQDLAPGRRADRRPQVHNLHWGLMQARQWPGIGHGPEEQDEFRRSLSSPLLCPADLAPWLEDARVLLREDRVGIEASERVALLHSLWLASQGLRRLLVHKSLAALEAGRTNERRPGGAGAGREFPGESLFPLFTLAPAKPPPPPPIPEAP